MVCDNHCLSRCCYGKFLLSNILVTGLVGSVIGWFGLLVGCLFNSLNN